ncbi:hypothetical protein BDZ89DRAFT_1066636, partial [Hymenopellis radicata]
SLGKFGEFFPGGGEAASIVRLLSSSGVNFPEDPLEGQPYKKAEKLEPSQTGICDLPCELQDAIFSELSDPVDVVAFCLTASHFWRIGLSHFKALYMEHVRDCQDWRGDRLICMGDYAADYPKGLLTDAEFETMKEEYCSSYDYDFEARDISRVLDYHSRSLSTVRWPSYDFSDRCTLKDWNPLARPPQMRPTVTNPILAAHLAKLFKDEEPENDLPQWLPRYKYDFYAWLRLPQASSSYDPRSLKVYVRDSALALTTDGGGSSVYHMSFGSLVLSRIAWSTDPSMSMADSESHNMHRGIWAGDRFDIVNIDAVQDDDDGWTDVSATARKELSGIWESVFGNHWEDRVRKKRL